MVDLPRIGLESLQAAVRSSAHLPLKGAEFMAQYECSVPRPSGDPLKLAFETGRSIIIIGANGSGKTRLGVHIERQIPAQSVQRIAAQKSLAIRDDINIISFDKATNLLRFGYQDGSPIHKEGHRWGSKPVTHFLSDFDALLQALFSEHSRVASEHLQGRKLNPNIPVPTTKLERLKTIWDGFLPHRALQIQEAAIQVCSQPSRGAAAYPGSDMSDGERAIFYFLGQSLVAPDNGVIIIDEPEGHIHKAILGALWDAIEKARPDCTFIYITHDLDFAVTHTASAKYFIRTYFHAPAGWEIEEVPENTGLPEQVVVELVGSRKPILFVEGQRDSLDLTIYQSHYTEFTIVPIGSCEGVIHSVASYKASAALHRLGVRGLVDGDDLDTIDITYLQDRDVDVLPVAEVENLLVLPGVFVALAEALLCPQPAELLTNLTSAVMKQATKNLDLVSARYATRQVDRRLKRVEVNAKDLSTLETMYQAQMATIDPALVFSTFKTKLEQRIQSADLTGVLRLYKSKGLLACAASLLGLKDQKYLLDKVGRLLGCSDGKRVREELMKVLPTIPV